MVSKRSVEKCNILERNRNKAYLNQDCDKFVKITFRLKHKYAQGAGG